MLSLLAAVPLMLALQATPASISGVVRRADTGEPIAGAVVTVPELARESRTDDRGRYALSGIVAGPWHLTVRALGFAPRTLHTLVPRTGGLALDLTLVAVPQRLAEVVVHNPMAARGTNVASSASFPARTVTRSEINTYPLIPERDVLLAINGGEVTMRPEMPSGVHIRGASADQTAYRLDGIPVLNPVHAAGMVSAWNPDAIASVRVATTLVDAPTLGIGGVVSATTRDATSSAGYLSASVGTTQARVTVHGAIGSRGGSYLLGVRSNAPASVVTRREGSYLRNDASDAIAKVEVPIFGGAFSVLDVQSDDEISASAVVPADGARADSLHNVFEWGGRSTGLAWSRATARGTVRLAGWQASSHAAAQWGGVDGESRLTLLNTRRDAGLTATLLSTDETGGTTTGVSLERSATRYQSHDASLVVLSALARRVVVPRVFARRSQSLTRTMRAEAGASAAALDGRVFVDPSVGFRWSPVVQLTTTAEYSHLHQFMQSLRNDESVVGSIFPAELFVSAGSGGVPVAESDLAVVGVNVHPLAGVRIAVQGFARRSRGLALAAAQTAEPFASRGFAVGEARARGASVEFALSARRSVVQLAYGAQRVRYAAQRRSWTPQFGTAQTVEGGITLFPTPTFSISVGAIGEWGRRTTAVVGAFEWESCNLRDRGCEFGGTPRTNSDALGATRLPAYFRADISARKHWHFSLAARPVEVSLFGTVTNVGNRRSLLTRAIDPVTRVSSDIGMRPQAPLVVGLDWRF